MPYDIYVLDESDVTVTGGQLDGVTQGDGSHMLGLTLTLNNNAWYPVTIDDNDANFQDSDSSQTLSGAQTIDGTSYGNGTVVEAEYSFTVTDGTSTWTVVAFNVNNSAPAYGTIEGLAFIGGPGGFPPVGVPLTVTSTSEAPNFAASSYATPICFVDGTLIETSTGHKRVEDINVGDLVLTADDGFQPVLWHGASRFAATGDLAPVCFAPGAIGNQGALRLSPQHRVLVEGWQAELFAGEDAVLVPARAFVNGTTVTQIRGGLVGYHHLLFDQHQIIYSQGVPSESFFPGEAGLSALDQAVQDELFMIFPELKTTCMNYGAMVRPAVRVNEGRALLAA